MICAELIGECWLVWTVTTVVLPMRCATCTLCGCLRVCGAGCLADDVSGGVLSLINIDVLGGR